jgi:hypothetical protein
MILFHTSFLRRRQPKSSKGHCSEYAAYRDEDATASKLDTATYSIDALTGLANS